MKSLTAPLMDCAARPPTGPRAKELRAPLHLRTSPVIADGSPAGRLLWEQPSGGAAVCNNWSVLWQGLRARVPDASYRDGRTVTAVTRERSCRSPDRAMLWGSGERTMGACETSS
jgi:hypothetical protein